MEVQEEEIQIRIVRESGMGLGISIAGGQGSTPFRGEDEVRPPYYGTADEVRGALHEQLLNLSLSSFFPLPCNVLGCGLFFL